MEKVYDAHVHYLFDIAMEKTIEIFKKEFAETETTKYNFLSIPQESHNGITLDIKKLQNVEALFLKKVFSPNAYAFAGVEYLNNTYTIKERSELYYNQAVEYLNIGFDGIKMLEGYPQTRKYSKVPLDDSSYDKFYSYLEEAGVPIIMHVANPKENWDISNVSKEAKALGRYCDETLPTYDKLISEVFGIMKKHPNLKLYLAHMGFLSYDINMAEKFLSYPKTGLDLTPGGEQLIYMQRKWDIWHNFFVKYQDKIIYGTDYYAFPDEDKKEWEICFHRRPDFLRKFFEDDKEFTYLDIPCKGVKLEKEIRDKIYRENFYRLLETPKKIDLDYLKSKLEKLNKEEQDTSKYYYEDIEYMLKNL